MIRESELKLVQELKTKEAALLQQLAQEKAARQQQVGELQAKLQDLDKQSSRSVALSVAIDTTRAAQHSHTAQLVQRTKAPISALVAQ